MPAEALWGIHTLRAVENFPLARRPVHRRLIHAFGAVKLAAAQANHELGRWDAPTFAAIETACREMINRPRLYWRRNWKACRPAEPVKREGRLDGKDGFCSPFVSGMDGDVHPAGWSGD